MSQSDVSLPSPPQTGYSISSPTPSDDQSGLWSQLLAAFRDLSGSFDSFANDADPQVRALGRLARQRRPQQTDDYFALGDMCARLTLRGNHLSGTYAAKTLAAYLRGAEISMTRARDARLALVAFGLWVAEVARLLDDYEALKTGVLVCDRVQQIAFVAQGQTDVAQLRGAAAQLRERMARAFADDPGAVVSTGVAAERESQLLCDQGQMLLRQSQPADALATFERALLINRQNHTAWLWRAMALTDLGRFNDALASYDCALVLEPESARVWNSKGALLMELGRIQPALDCFNRALALPLDAPTIKAAFWLNTGKALFKLERYHEARDALMRSHQLDPSAESAAGIAACDERLGAAAPSETTEQA